MTKSDETLLQGIDEYKYDFKDLETFVFQTKKGLDRQVVEQISHMKRRAPVDVRVSP